MILAIGLTEGGRQTLAILLVILHFISLLSGAGLCTVGFFLRFNLQSKVSLVDGYDGNVLPIVLMVVGGLVALVNLVGSKVAFDVANPVNRKRLRCLFIVLLVLLLISLLGLLTAGSMCFAHRHHLSRSFHHGLIKAMGKYQEDYTLKYDIDMLQIQNECCGNNGYEDWFDVQWIHNNFLDLSNKKVQSKMTTGQYLTDDVPFSCCQPTSPRPCIHHQVQDNDIHYNYDYHTDLTLHPVGCKEKLMEYFGSKFNKLGAGSFGLLGVQVIALLLARYLQTSIAGAIAEGDPEASAPGYLCPGGGDGPPPSKGGGRGSAKPKMAGGMVGGMVGSPNVGKGRIGPRGSMEDFRDHDLDAEEGYDTLLDDSTFDDDSDEFVNANTSNPMKSYNPYENKGLQSYGHESPYEEPIRHEEEEPLYENIPAYAPPAMEDLYENIPAYAPPVTEDLYENIPAYAPSPAEDLYENIPAYAPSPAEDPHENIIAYAPSPVEDFYETIPAYAAAGMEDLYHAATEALLPPMLPSGPPPMLPSGPPPKRPDGPPPQRPKGGPPQRPKQGPPPRPATGPPKRPDGPSPSKKSSPTKRPPPRPSQPPSRPSPGGQTKSGKKGPARPDKPPSKKVGGSQPKTSTPKKSAPKQNPKVDKKSIKSSPKRGGSASPRKSPGSKKASIKTKSAAHKTKSTRSKTSPKSKSVKRSPTKSPKKSPKRGPTRSIKRSPTKSIGKTKSAPKWKKGTSKGMKTRSRASKRGGVGKSKMKRSRNRNNNIVELSQSESEFTSSNTSETEETSSSSSSDSSSFDLETGSLSGDFDESDTSDTPLLRR